MDCESQMVDLLELNISEEIIGVDYAFGELWVLPIRGNKIYQIDEKGLIVNIAELLVENATDSLPCFARIVVQKKYLFLLPYFQKGIYVYDKQERKIQVIPEENMSLEKKGKIAHLRYWEYFVRDNKIHFLPYRDDYIEIDLDTSAFKEKKIRYPAIWTDEEKAWRNIGSHVSEQESVIRETDECNQNVFLKYIQHKTIIKNFSMHGYVGDMVWNVAKN